MTDYQVLSMDSVGGEVTIHPVALDVKDVPWAEKQMWAPDAAFKNGRYYLYFPVKDTAGIFRIGVAVGDRSEGPFRAEAPVKTFLNCTMPALVNISVGSLRGTSGLDSTIW